MSNVLVDRELLERACMRPGRESLAVNDRDIIERGRAQAEIRELLAQPAEADGVEVVGYQWLDSAHYRRKIPAHCIESHWRPLMTVANHQRILSAVTAERDAARDQLRAEVEALRVLLKEVGAGCNRRDMPSEAQITDWAERIDAAMTAKEGDL